MDAPSRLLVALRAGVLLVPWLPLLVARELPGVPDLFYPFVTLEHFVFRALVELLLVGFSLLAWLRPRYRPRASLGSISVALVVVVTAIADLLGADPARSLWSSLERMGGWIGLAHLAAYFVVARGVLDDGRGWRALALSSLAACGAVSVFAAAQWLAVVGGVALPQWLARCHIPLKDVADFRADARLGSPVFLADYAMAHVFLAGWFAGSALRRRGRVAYGGAAVLFAFVVFATGTRAAQAALVVGAVAAVALAARALPPRRGRRRLAVVVVGVVLLGVLLAAALVLAPELAQRVPGLRRLVFLPRELAQRSTLWEIGWRGFLERPWLGWGQENFGFVYDHYFDPALRYRTPWYDHPHNAFVGWLVAGGVLGAAAWTALFASLFFLLWRRGSPFPPLARAIATGGLVAHVVFHQFVFHDLHGYLMVLSLLACLEVTGRAGRPTAPVRPAGARSAALALAATAAVAWVFLALDLPAWRTARDLAAAAGGGGWPAVEKALAHDSFGRTEARYYAIRVALQSRSENAAPAALRRRAMERALRENLRELAGRPARARGLILTAQLENRLGDLLGRELHHAERGRAHYRHALELLQQAHALSPGRGMILRYQAKAWLGLGEPVRARELLRQAWAPRPHDPEAGKAYAVVALRTGQADVAAEVLGEIYPPEGSLQPHPDSRVVRALLDARRVDLLLAVYRSVVRGFDRGANAGHVPAAEVARVYLGLAELQAAGGRPERALATVQELVRRDPSQREACRAALARYRQRVESRRK